MFYSFLPSAFGKEKQSHCGGHKYITIFPGFPEGIFLAPSLKLLISLKEEKARSLQALTGQQLRAWGQGEGERDGGQGERAPPAQAGDTGWPLEPSEVLGNQSELVGIRRDVGEMEKVLPREVNHDLLERSPKSRLLFVIKAHTERSSTHSRAENGNGLGGTGGAEHPQPLSAQRGNQTGGMGPNW